MDLFETVLPSGIGIRFRLLRPSEGDRVLDAAQAGLSAGISEILWQRIKSREGAKAMLVYVTRGIVDQTPVPAPEGSPKGTAPTMPAIPEDAWVKWDPETYEEKFCDPRDDAGLRYAYVHHHEIGPSEVAGIMGKERRVTKD